MTAMLTQTGSHASISHFGGTQYATFGSNSFLSGTNAERARQVIVPCAGTFKNLVVGITRPSTGVLDVTFTLRKNGSATVLTVNDTTADGTDVVLTSTNDVTFSKDDLISLEVSFGVGDTSNVSINSFAVSYEN